MRAFVLVRRTLNRPGVCVRATVNLFLLQRELNFLDHEAQDAALFTSWKIDALKCKHFIQNLMHHQLTLFRRQLLL